jgi:hypothetical protein
LRTQVEKVYQERYGTLDSNEELKPDEEFNLAPPSDSGDEANEMDPLKLNSSDELGLDKDLSSAELESSFLSVPGSSPDLSGELSEDALNGNSSIKTPEDQERRSQIVDLEEQGRQEAKRFYEEIEEDAIVRFEKEHGPIKRELNNQEKARKKKIIEKEGGTWSKEDGFEYTEEGRKFILEKGPDSLESLADAEFLKDYPSYAEDLKSWKETKADFIGLEDYKKTKRESQRDIEKPEDAEAKKENVKLPKSKNLAETLESLDSEEKIEFLQKFRSRKASVLVKDENGNKTRQYLRLRDGDEFNVFEFTFEFFDENGNKVLNEDGSPKTKTQKISDIKYRDWEKIGIPSVDLGRELLYQDNQNGESRRIKFSMDRKGNYVDLDSNLSIPKEEIVTYEGKQDSQREVVYSRSIEKRSLSDTERGEVEKLKAEHDNLVNEVGSFCHNKAEQYKKENNVVANDFFEKRLAEVRNYDNSTIVDRIKKSDIEPWRIKEEISVLSERLKQYKKQAEIFDQQSVVKKVEEKKEAQPENAEDSVEAIEEEISRLIDNYSNLSAKQKLVLKNNETILVSSWPATIEMNRYQIATCVYQGVDVTTIKVKGFVPLVSETITFSLTDANKTKQELSWHDFFNTIDANYRDSLLPAIRDHIKNKTAKNNSSTEVPQNNSGVSGQEEVFEVESSEGVNSPKNPSAKEGNETAGNPEESDQEKIDKLRKEIIDLLDKNFDTFFDGVKKLKSYQESGKEGFRNELIESINKKNLKELQAYLNHLNDILWGRQNPENKDKKEVDETAQSEEPEKLDNVKKEVLSYVTREDILNILFEHEDEFNYDSDEMLTLPVENAQDLYQKILDKVSGMQTIEEAQNYRKILEGVIGKYLKKDKSPEITKQENEKRIQELRREIRQELLRRSNKKRAAAEKISRDEFKRVTEEQNRHQNFMSREINNINDVDVLENIYQDLLRGGEGINLDRDSVHSSSEKPADETKIGANTSIENNDASGVGDVLKAETKRVEELNRTLRRKIEIYLFGGTEGGFIPEILSSEDEEKIRRKIGEWVQKRRDNRLGNLLTPFFEDMENIRDNTRIQSTADVVIKIAKGQLEINPEDLDDKETRNLKNKIRASLKEEFERDLRQDERDNFGRNKNSLESNYYSLLNGIVWERDKSILKTFLEETNSQIK